jgi:MFS family permease
VLQGVGGGMIVLTFALVGDIVAPSERGRYQGMFGSVYGVAGIVARKASTPVGRWMAGADLGGGRCTPVVGAQRWSASTTAWAKTVGASCGRL